MDQAYGATLGGSASNADGDDLIVADLVEGAAAFAAADLHRVEQVALHEPLLVNRLIPPDARVTGVNVNIQLPGINPAAFPVSFWGDSGCPACA